MTDGITLGHPRCAVDTCREDLASNHDTFCPIHFTNHLKCAVRSCPERAVVGKMCANRQHQQMESLSKARNDAPFQLAKRMQRMHVSHPNDSMLSENAASDNHDAMDDLEGNIEWFELEGETADDVRMYNELNPGGVGEDDDTGMDSTNGESSDSQQTRFRRIISVTQTQEKRARTTALLWMTQAVSLVRHHFPWNISHTLHSEQP